MKSGQPKYLSTGRWINYGTMYSDTTYSRNELLLQLTCINLKEPTEHYAK